MALDLLIKYVDNLVGQRVSVLATDAYKFSMAQAGFPLRRETFYLALRRGGPHYLPFDFSRVLNTVASRLRVDAGDVAYLERKGYGLTPAMQAAALAGNLTCWSPPAGTWVLDGEPVLTVTEPSFLASWFEPLAIMFRFPIQVATAALAGQTEFRATCETERRIIEATLEAVGRDGQVTVDLDRYGAAVRERVAAVRQALGGSLDRAFEVGFRAASCLAMHDAALVVGKLEGLASTSNMLLAEELGLTPVGTTGHEHQQRWFSDLAGFRAIRDMRAAPPTYLLDTYDTMLSGIPAAWKALAEDPDRVASVRFDSGDQVAQLHHLLDGRRRRPGLVFEDSYTADRTDTMEVVCRGFDVRDARYGYGGYLVNAGVQFRRDDVSAVYKLSETGGEPVMKTCGDKSSLPGRPMVAVDEYGDHFVAQQGEELPPGCRPLEPGPRPVLRERRTWSGATARLIGRCNERRSRAIQDLREER